MNNNPDGSVVEMPVNADKQLTPDLYGYFTVSNLPYKLNRAQTITTVSDLIHEGASVIHVERIILDRNSEDGKAPDPRFISTELFNVFVAEIGSKYGEQAANDLQLLLSNAQKA